MAGFVRFFLVLVLLGVVAAVGAAYEFSRRLNADGPLAQTELLWVKRGMTPDGVASELDRMDAIADPLIFRIMARVDDLGASLKAGEYEIPPHASINDIVRILREGEQVLRFVTVPEGRTVAQVIRILEEEPYLTGTIEVLPVEGDLLPETYAFQRGDTRQSVIARMEAAHDAVLAELWAIRAEGLPIETPEEAVILASIVEKETGVAEERPLVASVFVNRLRRGMRLQSDPTIIYGLTKGEPLGRGLRRSEIDGETPYNTYRIRGLPPTPIANPGRDALAAVLNPAESEALYFVADGTGGHVFARTLAEHNRNVRNWRQIERQRAAGGN